MYVKLNSLGNWRGIAAGRRVKEVFLLKKEDILAVMDPAEFKNHFASAEQLSDAQLPLEGYTIPVGGLGVKTDAEVIKLDFANSRCTFDEPQQESDHGLIYVPVIATEIPRNHPLLAQWAMDNRYKQYIALWRDGNEMAYVSGSTKQGLTVSTQRVVDDGNKVVLAITGQCERPSWHLEGLDLEQHFAEADFSFEFSMDFNI